MISLRAHNVLDYLLGALLVMAPWIFGMADVTPARLTFLILGVGLITYSLLTNYYYSLSRIIPLGAHMTLDSISGVMLFLAPSLFGYRDSITEAQNAVHLVLGIATFSFVALTRPRTEAAKTPAERTAINQDFPIKL